MPRVLVTASELELQVCRLSGRLPTAACPGTREVWALNRRVPTDRCPLHVEVDVDWATGLALAPGCRSGHSYKTTSFVSWPAAVVRWLGDQHRGIAGPPSLAPWCQPSRAPTPPRISWPPPGQTLVLLPGVDPADQEVPLEAKGAVSGARLSWFVDGAYLGTVTAESRLWWQPSPGRHQLTVVDDSGSSAERTLEVRGSGSPGRS